MVPVRRQGREMIDRLGSEALARQTSGAKQIASAPSSERFGGLKGLPKAMHPTRRTGPNAFIAAPHGTPCRVGQRDDAMYHTPAQATPEVPVHVRSLARRIAVANEEGKGLLVKQYVGVSDWLHILETGSNIPLIFSDLHYMQWIDKYQQPLPSPRLNALNENMHAITQAATHKRLQANVPDRPSRKDNDTGLPTPTTSASNSPDKSTHSSAPQQRSCAGIFKTPPVPDRRTSTISVGSAQRVVTPAISSSFGVPGSPGMVETLRRAESCSELNSDTEAKVCRLEGLTTTDSPGRDDLEETEPPSLMFFDSDLENDDGAHDSHQDTERGEEEQHVSDSPELSSGNDGSSFVDEDSEIGDSDEGIVEPDNTNERAFDTTRSEKSKQRGRMNFDTIRFDNRYASDSEELDDSD
ncbi:hypothetical protein IAR55_007196 [Kwoniella newhampshirensis]|uniref:Transcription elongation factor Eaf N-terminal domain-containing protein n=1 Tax=Kwoniella newhampshirensis TaxID=1651941 RepID=A0AAW0YS64_9TREE